MTEMKERIYPELGRDTQPSAPIINTDENRD